MKLALIGFLGVLLSVSFLVGCGDQPAPSKADRTDVDAGAALEAPPAVPQQAPDAQGDAGKPVHRVAIKVTMEIQGLQESTEPGDTLPSEDLASVPALTRWLASEDYGRRVLAATQLGVLGKRAAGAQSNLKSALQDDTGTVRVAAALALWQVTGQAKESLAALADLLRRGGSGLRIESAWALGAMGKAAEPLIGDLLKLMNGTLARSGKEIDYSAGTIIGGPGYISTSPASAAAEALGDIGAKRPDVIAALKVFAKTGKSYEQERAAEALERLQAR